MDDKGGIVLDTGGAYRFLPASVVANVTPAEPIVPVPGLQAPAIGLVMTEDRVATALCIGSHCSEHMVVCRVEGGWVALHGARVVATGLFPRTKDGAEAVEWNGETAEVLNVGALTVEVEEAIWRAAGASEHERLG
ncbi:MAG: hypothetical protein CSA75_01885 [Sorangium cellulosum]|nr:MAG: hypothetical protein CSA75_01885 [Sorangium cellulosum]